MQSLNPLQNSLDRFLSDGFSNGCPDLFSTQNPVSVTENGEETCITRKRKLQSSPKSKATRITRPTAVSKENEKAPKTDYIHVRARRGQATDSHSLAERVRRARISQRMKCLQELVPGCSKATGKAGVLDKIIDYVQSLQRQVELLEQFLSMKLAAVDPAESRSSSMGMFMASSDPGLYGVDFQLGRGPAAFFPFQTLMQDEIRDGKQELCVAGNVLPDNLKMEM
ncbi:hypothetical protein ZIOFF_065890 [Zingiber officinale]|uniref:BHLH domain-containing protein n=1 Tax=Zingiber officinale TaxID=94328 RepID=A0A8J5EYF4_ZINOF|nr:hypothetical protein ZIOFF_065890 [Zingiber officinale]